MKTSRLTIYVRRINIVLGAIAFASILAGLAITEKRSMFFNLCSAALLLSIAIQIVWFLWDTFKKE
ncbi:hypothetical protein JZO70_08385 [Enterococcus sp. 669A]|uniref:Uncharacterized protein n=1 Tax=Candidatus Enterococcus moelleringii TaxID=2815325 RepID=A0ABS3L977_9ENTE|nr:hypothetical protein [Enterococcus sp. 669A]MBO1306175.1 hypothetical protein [Enterococcus sp. 669A]